MEVFEVTVKRDEEIHKVISDFVIEKNWDEAIIIGAVGSVKECEFNAPVDNSIPMNLKTIECPNAAELVGFNGEIMKREKMDPNLAKVYKDTGNPLFVHIHASCVNGNGNFYGGGLKKGKAFRAVRVFLIPLNQ